MTNRYPVYCCVRDCRSKANSHTEIKRWFHHFVRKNVPVRNPSSFRAAIYKKRYRRWVELIQPRTEKTNNLIICSQHFVSGRPAGPLDTKNVDWAPSLKMGHCNTSDALKTQRNLSVMVENIEPLIGLANLTAVPEISQYYQECSQTDSLDLEGTFCRLCLKNFVFLKPLFPFPLSNAFHLAGLVEKYAGIQIDFMTDYNSSVCHGCLMQLQNIHKSVQQWLKNDERLQQYRSNKHQTAPSEMVAVEIKTDEDELELDDDCRLRNGTCTSLPTEQSTYCHSNSTNATIHGMVTIPIGEINGNEIKLPVEAITELEDYAVAVQETIANDETTQEAVEQITNIDSIDSDCICVSDGGDTSTNGQSDLELIKSFMKDLRSELRPSKRRKTRKKHLSEKRLISEVESSG